MRYKIIRDTREQDGQGWIFDAEGDCDGTIRTTLKTGDYTIEGFEAEVCVERKGTAGEFAHNLTEARFERELARMNDMNFPLLILEFEFADLYRFPKNSGIPESKWKRIKITPQYIIKRLFEIQIKYPNVKIVFAGYGGSEYARMFFKYFARGRK